MQLCTIGIILLAGLLSANSVPAGEVVIVTSFPKELFETCKQAFEAQHPDLTVVIKSKSTSAAVAYVQETAARPDTDLIWASAIDAFEVLKEEGLLARETLPEPLAARIPAQIGPYPIHDPDGAFFGFALSGYGLMWNKPYTRAYRLQPPAEWTDLTAPAYHGHISMSAPSRSGTTHLMVEVILQAYGWEKGWEILLNLGGNAATITERSFGVPQGVNNGEFGIGLVIDFFALSAIASGFPVDFVYPSSAPVVPAGIGRIKNGPNPENARKFIHFLLDEPGQKLLFEPQISRLPVIPDLYAQAPAGFPNPFQMQVTGAAFDTGVSKLRYGLINSLFDQIITFRLQDLKAAWGAIYKAEAAIQKAQTNSRNTDKARELLAQARTLVTRAPVSETRATDPEFCAAFANDSAQAQAAYETEWDARTKAGYARARELAAQAMDTL